MLLTFIMTLTRAQKEKVLLEFLDFAGKRLYNMSVHNGSL